MKITILSHNLSSNAAMRAHRLAHAAKTFAEVKLIGPIEKSGLWPALPPEPWIETVPKRRFPEFFNSFLRLIAAADADVLIAAKPHLASFGVALVQAELRDVPVILDHDDLDVALAPRSRWTEHASMAELSRPGSAVYLSLLTKASPAASAITVASSALQKKFAGTLVPHGALTEWLDPRSVDRAAARQEFGLDGPTVLFAGTPRQHKGIPNLVEAVLQIPKATLAFTGRPQDFPELDGERRVLRIPIVPYTSVGRLLAAADVVAIPQLDVQEARYQMPMKIFDCMAMSCPIVATTVSDIPDVLQDCAQLVPPGDTRQLTQAIVGLLQNPEEARALGERARKRCLEKFSMNAVGKKLFEVVERVMEQTPQGVNGNQ